MLRWHGIRARGQRDRGVAWMQRWRSRRGAFAIGQSSGGLSCVVDEATRRDMDAVVGPSRAPRIAALARAGREMAGAAFSPTDVRSTGRTLRFVVSDQCDGVVAGVGGTDVRSPNERGSEVAATTGLPRSCR